MMLRRTRHAGWLTAITLPVLLVAASAAAEPDRSQHSRSGELSEVDFGLGSMVVADHENHKLESAVAWAASYPDGLLVVGGHAEHSDQPAADLKLSLRRAQAVRDALIRAGAEPDQIVIAAYGSGATSHADPAEDRRVTIWSTREGLYDAVSGVRDADIVVVRGEEIHPRGVVADR